VHLGDVPLVAGRVHADPGAVEAEGVMRCVVIDADVLYTFRFAGIVVMPR
jgi:hypothetical protein